MTLRSALQDRSRDTRPAPDEPIPDEPIPDEPIPDEPIPHGPRSESIDPRVQRKKHEARRRPVRY